MKYIEELIAYKEDIDAVQITEILWLSQFMGSASSEVEKPNTTPKIDDTKIEEPKKEDLPDIEEEEPKPIDESTPIYEDKKEKYGFDKEQDNASMYTTNITQKEKFPEIEKQFQSLKVKQNRISKESLDEVKTADYIATTGYFHPIFSEIKSKESYFSLHIIIDKSESMFLWESYTKHFIKSMKFSTIFTSIRIFELDSSQKEPSVYAMDSDHSINLNSAIFREEKSITLVFSDITGDSWKSNRMFEVLDRWSKGSFVTIVSMLPKRMWKKTPLRQGISLFMKPRKFLPKNKDLKAEFDFMRTKTTEKGTNIPMLTFDSYAFSHLSNVLMSKKESWIDTRTFKNLVIKEVAKSKKSNISPKERVKNFFSFALPKTRELAVYCSVLPLTQEIIREVIKARDLGNEKDVFSEFYFGGLIDKDAEVTFGEYAFYEGVAKELRQYISVQEMKILLHQVSEVMSSSFGVDTKRLNLLYESANDGEELNDNERALVELMIEVLEDKGRFYEGEVRRLKTLNKSLFSIKKIIAKESGYIRFYNLDLYKNSENKLLISNNEFASVLLVEPKVKSLTRGKLTIVYHPDEINITVQQGAKEQKYTVQKNDVVIYDYLIANGKNVKGKLFIPYRNGDLIEEGDSLIEIIKESWSIPNKIPFRANLKVEYGTPLTQNIIINSEGILKYFLLKGDYLERFDISKGNAIVTEEGLFAVIVDMNEREVARYYIPKESLLLIDDNATVFKDTLIAESYSKEEPIIAEWKTTNTIKENDIQSKVLKQLYKSNWKEEYIERSSLLKNNREAILLHYNGMNLAIIEMISIKYYSVEELTKMIQYGRKINIEYLYFTDGKEIYEYSLTKNVDGKYIKKYPSPDELFKLLNKPLTISELMYFENSLIESKLKIKKLLEENGMSHLKGTLTEEEVLENALKKIENNTYAICEACEKNINIERLKIKPFTEYCIDCKTNIEKGWVDFGAKISYLYEKLFYNDIDKLVEYFSYKDKQSSNIRKTTITNWLQGKTKKPNGFASSFSDFKINDYMLDDEPLLPLNAFEIWSFDRFKKRVDEYLELKSKKIKFSFLKANSGESIIVSTENTNIIIDGGTVRTYKQELKHKIEDMSVLDLVIVTHRDDNHAGGLWKLIEDDRNRKKIKEIWFNGFFKENEIRKSIILSEHLIQKYNIPYKNDIFLSEENYYQSYQINDIQLELLSPMKKDYEYNNMRKISNQNILSIAFILKYQNKKFLFLADAHIEVIKYSLQRLGYSKKNRLEVDFIKLSHGGSIKNIDSEFLDMVSTDRYVILTDGRKFDFPHKETLELILTHELRKESIELICNYRDVLENKLSEEEVMRYNCKLVYASSMEF